MRVHQLVHTLHYGDAISGEALAIERILRAEGVDSNIYCLHIHEKLSGMARDIDELSVDIRDGCRKDDTALILHYSISSVLNDVFCGNGEFCRAVIYHNLTPAHWFRAYNRRVAEDLEAGRRELPRIIEKADLLFADSEYNKKELNELGRSDVSVIPLLLDEEKWSVKANRGIASLLKGHGGKNLLFVGRIAPNKCIEDVIKAFYFYHHKIEPRSRLWIVGSDTDTEIYSFELRRLVSQLRLRDAVTFAGAVADCELRAFYENSDVYISMSEHEGFCVPLIEAMYFSLPIIAYDAGAVASTLCESGVLVSEKAPELLAELINIAVSDLDVRCELIRAGGSRVRAFMEDAFVGLLRENLIEGLMT